MATIPVGTIEVCYDCAAVSANGETETQALDATPWALWADEPADLQPTPDWGEDEDENEYGQTTFDTAPCQGCGSHLYGSRFRFATWARV
jgi:hypothetical protein